MWKVKLIFMGQEILLPGEWKDVDEAQWSIAQWKEKVQLFGDPFIFFRDEEKR